MRLALFFHLGGDVDVLAPILARALKTGKPEVRVLVAEKLLTTNQRLSILLGQLARHPDFVVPADADTATMDAALSGADALLTSSETTLRPHRLAHALTQRANETGVQTFTLQHGVENVGITYFDDKQGPEVAFASRNVLTWGGAPTICPEFSDETKRAVRDVGYAEPLDECFADWRKALPLPTDHRPVVGVFENLHWTRFSDGYREKFLADLADVIDEFPDALFLLKPHPEGRWLTERFGGERPAGDNLCIADPADPAWKPLTAPYLMPILSAVITTPSKVAMDAALADLPTAVASYDGDYPRYAGLDALASGGDWAHFLRDAIANRIEFRAKNAQFLGHTVSSLDGARNTLDLVAETCAVGAKDAIENR